MGIQRFAHNMQHLASETSAGDNATLTENGESFITEVRTCTTELRTHNTELATRNSQLTTHNISF